MQHEPLGSSKGPIGKIARTVRTGKKAGGTELEVSLVHADRSTTLLSRLHMEGDVLEEEIANAANLSAVDEAESLPVGSHAFLLRVLVEDGRELSRQRFHLPGKIPIVKADPGAVAKDNDTSGPQVRLSRLGETPADFGTALGLSRQQMRHNEALVALVVRNAESLTKAQEALLDKLGSRVDVLTDKLIGQADLFLNQARQQRVLEAEARRDDAKTEAMKLTAQVIAEWLPVGIHKIARKYGMAGDAELDPMLEKMITSFQPEQLPAIAQALTPIQRAQFAEIWDVVQVRAKKKEAEKKKAENGNGNKALPEKAGP
jgi:hypothetical protein